MSTPLSKKIVCYDGKLWGKPCSILDTPYTAATLTTEEMRLSRFPWDKVRTEYNIMRGPNVCGHLGYIVRYVPWNTHLSVRFQTGVGSRWG